MPLVKPSGDPPSYSQMYSGDIGLQSDIYLKLTDAKQYTGMHATDRPENPNATADKVLKASLVRGRTVRPMCAEAPRCTWNADVAEKRGAVVSDNGITLTLMSTASSPPFSTVDPALQSTAAVSWRTFVCNEPLSHGTESIEFTINAVSSTGAARIGMLGVTTEAVPKANGFVGISPSGWAYDIRHGGAVHKAVNSALGPPVGPGDRVLLTCDFHREIISVSVNDQSIGIAFRFVGSPLYPAVSLVHPGDSVTIRKVR